MNFFRTVFATCSHFRNYRAIRDVPVTKSLKYIALLITLLSLLGFLSYLPVIHNYTESFATWADTNLPELSIKDGKAMTTVAQPYRRGNDQFLFLLDTTGQTTHPETNALMGLLVESNQLTFWVNYTNTTPATVRSQHADLRGFPDGVVNGDYFRQFIRAFAWVGLPLFFLVITLVALFTVLTQAYIFALIATLMERNHPRSLRLTQLLNIAIHAATPAALVYTIYQTLRLGEFDLWLVYLVIYGVYVVGAASACREQIPTEAPEKDKLL
ncbi:MAG: hypothetical protein PCFJNLEI_03020 [Verrucomicrobiae bacterium]|nr:hypothetical protein [Verrucomicrobiae bacterium]